MLLQKQLTVRGRKKTVFYYDVVPLDLHWSSIKDKLNNGVFKTFGKYWPSKAAVEQNKKTHKKKIEVEVESGESEDEILRPPFEE